MRCLPSEAGPFFLPSLFWLPFGGRGKNTWSGFLSQSSITRDAKEALEDFMRDPTPYRSLFLVGLPPVSVVQKSLALPSRCIHLLAAAKFRHRSYPSVPSTTNLQRPLAKENCRVELLEEKGGLADPQGCGGHSGDLACSAACLLPRCRRVERLTGHNLLSASISSWGVARL